MKKFFEYNWQVREDWFTWCEEVPEEELLKKRTGGIGGILHTLFHIADVEWSWIRVLQGKPDFEEPFEAYASLQKVRDLSKEFHKEVQPFVSSWTDEMENRILTLPRSNGSTETFKHGEIMRHTLAHEIHHSGQISVWAREIGKKPVSANLIGRGLFNESVNSL